MSTIRTGRVSPAKLQRLEHRLNHSNEVHAVPSCIPNNLSSPTDFAACSRSSFVLSSHLLLFAAPQSLSQIGFASATEAVVGVNGVSFEDLAKVLFA